ncbi:MAG: hypothetical protein ACJAZK_000984 [Psychroserpens sp.]|jgi:hypothetical protein
MKAVENRWIENNLVGAYSEFKLVQAISPNDENINQLLIETLVALCEDDTKYCRELDIILTSSL